MFKNFLQRVIQNAGDVPVDISAPKQALLLMLFLLASLLPVSLNFATEPNSARCKYSVRDVGFVNVHSFGWRLTLAKPPELSKTEFEQWDAKIAVALQRTNVHHLWVAPDSQVFSDLRSQLRSRNTPAETIGGILSSSNDEHFVFCTTKDGKSELEPMIRQAEQLANSPFRQKILEACCDSLCTVILIESASQEKNAAARKLLTAAINKLDKQMWMLEKPTEKAPGALVLTIAEQESESWFCRSIGLGSTADPTFAIAYGQGRILGDLIPLDQASVDKLVGTASICGGDCECELDKDWLYGRQFVHRWPKDLERRAEKSLNFDPHAAYVKSEVASIVRKTRTNPNAKRIDLGPGLIIHDLDDLETKADLARQNTTGTPEAISKNPRDQSDTTRNSKPSDRHAPSTQAESRDSSEIADQPAAPNQTSNRHSDQAELHEPAGNGFRAPVVILVLLALVFGGVIFWSLMRAA